MVQEKLNFLLQLYIDLATENKCTVQDLEDDTNANLPASEFYLHLNYMVQNDGHLKRPIIFVGGMLEDKDNPGFELEYRIFRFYERLSTENRKVLFENYRSHLEFYEMAVPKSFDAEDRKIPPYLLKYLRKNSEMFFVELDVSDGFIWAESLLQMSRAYVEKLQSLPDEFLLA